MRPIADKQVQRRLRSRLLRAAGGAPSSAVCLRLLTNRMRSYAFKRGGWRAGVQILQAGRPPSVKTDRHEI